jgi:hypothetical protein
MLTRRRYRHQRHPRTRRKRSRPLPTFLDGPAAGEPLPLTRAPKLLRVTQNGPCFRSLEHINAEPEETELIYVYQITTPATENHNRANHSIYRYLQPQPADGLIRLTHAWRGWVGRQLASKRA